MKKSGLSELEAALLGKISAEEMWKHCEAMNEIHRVSGTEGDYEGVDYIVDYLNSRNVPVEVIKFNSLVSYPIRASLRCLSPVEREIRAKTRAFSAQTPPQGLEGELVYVPTKSPGVGVLEAAAVNEYAGIDVAGKIVISERGGPDGIWDAQRAGAAGIIHVWPSDEDVIHEMICSPVWGTPTPESAGNLPTIPIVGVTRADGLWLVDQAKNEKTRVLLRNDVERHWRELRMPVVTIRGAKEPDKFVLVGGHLDSWYVGVTDNATGNACCLEMARVFHEMRGKLDRSVKIAWWPGHSYGRYSGSTYFCDTNWQDIHDNCIAYDNIDSPGVRGASDYSNVTAMPEAAELAESVVMELVGAKSKAVRPSRAGDQSFWGTGATSIFMLLSDQPAEKRAAVGGSGGGWWWHSEYDTLDKADPDRLRTDTQLHSLAVLKLLQDPLAPFKFVPLAKELKGVIERCQTTAGKRFDLSPSLKAAEAFAHAAEAFDKKAAELAASADDKAKRCFTEKMIAVTRAINPVAYTVTGPFDQDPATPSPTLPGLNRVNELDLYCECSDMYGFLLTRLTREQNRTISAFTEAIRAME